MPMFTTSVMVLPLKPFHSPLRTFCKITYGYALSICRNFLQSAIKIVCVHIYKQIKWVVTRMSTHMAKALHLLQDSVHVRHHVFTVHHDGSVRAVSQGSVQNSTTLTKQHTQLSSTLKRLNSNYALFLLTSVTLVTVSCELCLSFIMSRKRGITYFSFRTAKEFKRKLRVLTELSAMCQ